MQKSLSVRLKPEVNERLQAEAQASSLDVGEVAAAAIETYLEAQAEKRVQALAAVAAADNGIFISGEKMRAWIESWGSDEELPAPDPDIFLDKPKST